MQGNSAAKAGPVTAAQFAPTPRGSSTGMLMPPQNQLPYSSIRCVRPTTAWRLAQTHGDWVTQALAELGVCRNQVCADDWARR